MNWADILILAILALIVGIAVYVIVKRKKSGKSSCGCDKGNCSSGCIGCLHSEGCKNCSKTKRV